MSDSATQYAATVRWLIRRDLERVLEIEQLSFPEPFSEEEMLDQLRKRNCIGMVAKTPDEQVVGFMIYELHKDRLILMDIAVHPAHRGKGYGTALIDRLRSKLSLNRRKCIELVCSEYNDAAHEWLRSRGFFAVAVHRGLWGDTDGYEFELWCDD